MADISGTATYEDGTALSGATVTAEDQEAGEVIGTTTTNADGTYTITDVPATTAQVLIEHQENGTVYRDYAKPYVVVESALVGNPVSFWPHKEGSGSVLYDTEGTRDGDIIGSTWQTGAGYEDIYLEHDGTDDYVSLGTWAMPNTNGAFSVVMWVRFDAPTGDSQPMFGEQSASIRIHKSGSGDNVYSRWHNASEIEVIPAGSLTSGWHMLAVTRAEDDTARSYYDDNGVHDTNTWGETPSSVEHQLASTVGWSSEFVGATDYVLLYDYQLTDQEILDIYNDTSGNYP